MIVTVVTATPNATFTYSYIVWDKELVRKVVLKIQHFLKKRYIVFDNLMT
jgi:hypothetical protein